ncbi:MAG: hypothetical protein JRG79_17125, partial [Deltaproteobacteria bacterium]|nr:hypothetical protein [Deltaproteobacteria bacterium]
MSDSPTFIWILSLINLGIIGMAGLFAYESVREEEPRAPKMAAAATAFHLLLGVLILAWPSARVPIAWLLGMGLVLQAVFLIPYQGKAGKPKS